MAAVTVTLSVCVTVAAEQPPYHVLLTNDDGISSPGLKAVTTRLSADPRYRATIVAPAEQQSGKGTALTLDDEIEVQRRPPIFGQPAWAVGATPATTVQIALLAVLEDDPPALVVSGINRGENIGRSAWYSGTVGAAREAAMAGVPAIACSLELDWDDPQPDFDGAARWLAGLIEAVRLHGLRAGTLLNVNIPRDIAAIRGFRLARMGLTPPDRFGFDAVRRTDDAVWYSGYWRPPIDGEPGSDIRLIRAGWIPIVPLGLDQSQDASMAVLQELVQSAYTVVESTAPAPCHGSETVDTGEVPP
jgi:5'-nucleotidase